MLRIRLHSTNLATYVGEDYIVKTFDDNDKVPIQTLTEVAKMTPDKDDYTITFRSNPYRKSVKAILNSHLRRVEDVMKNPHKYDSKPK
jgi:hypothetical protein